MVNSGVNTYPKYYLFGFGVNPSKKNFVYRAHVRNIKLPSVHPHSYLENVANNSKPQQNTAPDLPF